MGKKLISLLVTEEQYKVIVKAANEYAIENSKRRSTSAYIINIVMNHLRQDNKKESKVVKQDSKQEGEQSGNLWDSLSI